MHLNFERLIDYVTGRLQVGLYLFKYKCSVDIAVERQEMHNCWVRNVLLNFCYVTTVGPVTLIIRNDYGINGARKLVCTCTHIIMLNITKPI